MKNITKIFLLLTVSMLISCGGGGGDDGNDDNNTSKDLPNLTPARSYAFPGADGGARAITGGAGGEVYIVTNLNDNGAGSLRQGLQKGNVTIVFAVAGQINLSSKLTISRSNITIAGQSAPGDGITIAGYPVYINGSNVIIRYMRFRLGDQNIDKSNFDADDGDALGGKDCKNVIIDHCSISYSTDECASFSRIDNFTLQYCIISESLKLAGHSKGNHGYGGIWGGRNASYHHNLLADHDSRNPRFDHSYVGGTSLGPLDYINNVVYNWGGNSTYGGESANETSLFHINMIGNYYKPGTSSSHKNRLLELTSICNNCNPTAPHTCYPGKFFISGNNVNGTENKDWDGVDTNTETRTRDQLIEMAKLDSRWATGLTPMSYTESATDAYNTVLNYAGASYRRDAVDSRIVNDVKNGTGAIIDKVSDNMDKYFPPLNGGSPIVDTDNDGMPDNWEMEQMTAIGVTGNAVSEFNPSAYNLTAKYTNIEVYLNSLVINTFPNGANAGAIK